MERDNGRDGDNRKKRIERPGHPKQTPRPYSKTIAVNWINQQHNTLSREKSPEKTRKKLPVLGDRPYDYRDRTQRKRDGMFWEPSMAQRELLGPAADRDDRLTIRRIEIKNGGHR